MKYDWQDLPKKITVFTVRSATMRNLDNGKIVQHYSSNTRIDLSQKCVFDGGTYYRTQSAANSNLNWAFEASAFGLPNEEAPSAHSFTPPNKLSTKNKKKSKTPALAKDGESKATKGGFKKLFLMFKKK